MKVYDALNKLFNVPFIEDTCAKIIGSKEDKTLSDKKILANYDKIVVVSSILQIV